MDEKFSRFQMLCGETAMQTLKSSRVAVFGAGGVGGMALEALARSGVGIIDVFDNDVIAISNLNRQVLATVNTIGIPKVEAARNRLKDINTDITVNMHNVFYSPENADEYDLSVYDYIIDAIDTVTAKIELIVRAREADVPIISSMGTGNKIHPERFELADIKKTCVCPLARVMRRELKKRGIDTLTVVYSTEPAMEKKLQVEADDGVRRDIPGSTAFCPGTAGLILAGEVVRKLINID